EHLTFTKAYLTWSKESHELEDRLGALWREMKARSSDFQHDRATAKLGEIEGDLRKVTVSYQEWEVLFREKLVLERALLRAAAGMESRPEEAAEEPRDEFAAATASSPSSAG